MTDVESDVSRAGRLSAAATPGRFAAPFDHLERGVTQARRTQHHPEARKAIQRGILQVRRQQGLWRAEKRILEATSHGRNLARPRDQVSRPTMLILGRYTVACHTETFRSHWKSIMTTPAEQGGDQQHGPDIPTFGLEAADFRDVVPVPAPHPGAAAAVDLELLVRVLRRLRRGRAGGTEGVAAEIVTALDHDGKEALTRVLRDVLEGTTPMPDGWSLAEVALLPTIIGAATPDKFRPITILPVMFKICMRAWQELAGPFLQLRSRASPPPPAGRTWYVNMMCCSRSASNPTGGEETEPTWVIDGRIPRRSGCIPHRGRRGWSRASARWPYPTPVGRTWHVD